METTKVITPYFENGVFAGVRVTLGDEDFVIAPKDYMDGKEMTWPNAMVALKTDGLDTWNYRQICHTMAYRKEIDKVFNENGGDNLRRNQYWILEQVDAFHPLYYNGFYGFLYWTIKSDTCIIRLIKNLKK